MNADTKKSSQKKLIDTLNNQAKINECANVSASNHHIEKELDKIWKSADELRANSKIRPNEYSSSIFGLLYLKYLDHSFSKAYNLLVEKRSKEHFSIKAEDYHALGVIYLPDNSRYGYLLNIIDVNSIGRAIDSAFISIERENKELRNRLPITYSNMDGNILLHLLQLINSITLDSDDRIYGKPFEFFIDRFAKAEGRRGGEYYTPTSIVHLIVDILEPLQGSILDPACGTGGFFIQSSEFVKKHRKDPQRNVSFYGQDIVKDTIKLCKMNLNIHGLSGDIKQGNTYYKDEFDMIGKFDFVMSDPPFNVRRVDKEAIREDNRYPFGLPNSDNSNYLWIQIMYSMLNHKGKAGFVMANSAGDARYTEMEIRKNIIQDGVVDVIISISSNLFYNVSLPVSLWFFNKGKKKEDKEKVLFIDTKKIFTQVGRAHREFSDQELEFISNIVRLYHRKNPETSKCSSIKVREFFPEMRYNDIKGLCKVVSINEIEEQGWSLNPERYLIDEKISEIIESGEYTTGLVVDTATELIQDLKNVEENLSDDFVIMFEDKLDQIIANTSEANTHFKTMAEHLKPKSKQRLVGDLIIEKVIGWSVPIVGGAVAILIIQYFINLFK